MTLPYVPLRDQTMSKEKLTVPNQRPKAAATQPLETVKAAGSSGKSAWSLTKIQILSGESLK